jgi:hypothetical protein
MSLDLHCFKNLPFNQPKLSVKSEMEILSERRALKESLSTNSNFQLISEIYESIRSIRDPERPYTLEQLDVFNMNDISVEEKARRKTVIIYWRPPFPICAFTVHIGLAIRLKLEREIKDFDKMRLFLFVKNGNLKQKKVLDKQLNDKERIVSAKENQEVMHFLESLIA